MIEAIPALSGYVCEIASVTDTFVSVGAVGDLQTYTFILGLHKL